MKRITPYLPLLVLLVGIVAGLSASVDAATLRFPAATERGSLLIGSSTSEFGGRVPLAPGIGIGLPTRGEPCAALELANAIRSSISIHSVDVREA